MILGIDEVGRGCWAGPLVVGAVVLGGAEIDGLTDSKALTKKRREALNELILEQASGVGLGWVAASEIDEIGLSQALRLATKRAVHDVGCSFHEIILDGTVNFLRDTPLERHVTLMKKADLLVPSVSAASIVAKVARDRYMTECDNRYDGYRFASHVGYGTAAHRLAIEQQGVCVEHRLSFAPLVKYATQRHSGLDLESNQSQSWMVDQVRHDTATTSTKKDPPTTRTIGDLSETAAAMELQRRGHQIIERNWKTKYCEIDIVSRCEDVYYFTEVKHRKDNKAGDGLAAITPKKLNQMRYAAKFYAHTQRLAESDLRLLAVATTGHPPAIAAVVDIQ